jgi:hypothetical protein
LGNDGPNTGTGGGPSPLRHLPPFSMRIADQFTPAILKTLHEKEIKELIDKAMAKDSRLSIGWWWLDPRKTSEPPRKLDAKQVEALKAHRRDLEKETRRILDELAHTPAGFQLLNDLVNASPKFVTVNNWDGPRNDTHIEGDTDKAYEKKDGTPSSGTSATIGINPTLTTFAVKGEKELPWMTERVQFGLYHELVHAWHIQHGTLARGDHNGIPNAEWQAVGLGPYASSPISENKIREQMGKDLRPDVDRKQY